MLSQRDRSRGGRHQILEVQSRVTGDRTSLTSEDLETVAPCVRQVDGVVGRGDATRRSQLAAYDDTVTIARQSEGVWLEDCSISETRGRITFANDHCLARWSHPHDGGIVLRHARGGDHAGAGQRCTDKCLTVIVDVLRAACRH